MLYNRRKRDAWYKDQMNAYHAALGEAMSRYQEGLSLDEDQVLLLNNLRAKAVAEERRRREGGFIKKGWRWVIKMSGLKTAEVEGEGNVEEEVDEDAPTGPMGMMVELGRRERGDANEFEIIRRMHEKKVMREKGIDVDWEPMSPVEKIEKENVVGLVPDVAAGVKGGERTGGPLDQMAANIVEDGQRRIGSWGRSNR